MSRTYTRSTTNTYSEANAIYVNDKLCETFLGIASAGHIGADRAEKWADDLLYIMNQQALSFFQIQFALPNGTRKFIECKLISDGTIFADDLSGGVDYYALPKGTTVSLCVELNHHAQNYQAVNQELERRGWGSGAMETGNTVANKSFSKNGYGINLNMSANWD